MDLRFVILVVLIGVALSFPTRDNSEVDEKPSTLQENPVDMESETDPVDKDGEVLETVEISDDQEDPITEAGMDELKFESPEMDADAKSDWDQQREEDIPLIELVGYGKPHRRQKRWVGPVVRLGRIGYNALRGYLARRRMLAGARSNQMRRNVREHFTRGNYGDAVKRYRDLGGKMKPFKNYAMEGFSSKVGNRRFTVRTSSSSRGVPTLHSHKITESGRKIGPIDKLRFMD